eukprot:m.308409 g.308409  ORF g.308409 m.308409 type:complete len:87 (+) comp43954_c0_seq1:52-312(+)
MDRLRNAYRERFLQESPAGGIVNRSNKVPVLQSFFQKPSPQPVFLRSASDLLIYRGAMVGAGLGVCVALASLYMMATGTMPKKSNV